MNRGSGLRRESELFLIKFPFNRLLAVKVWMSCSTLVVGLKDDFLYLHVVEDVVSFQGLAHRHDLIGHEAVPRNQY